MQDAGIRKKYLWAFHLAFSDILIPWLQLTDHKGPGENVQVRTDGFAG